MLCTLRRTASAFTLAGLGLLCLLPGCGLRKAYPPQAVVSSVELEGNRAIQADPLLQGLATSDSQRFLGIWDGVAFEYEVYDPDLLSRDLERVERYLARRGYYEAKVLAARVIAVDEHRVRIVIRVSEGSPVITQRVSLTGLESVPIAVAAQVVAESPLQTGAPFDEDLYQQTKQHLLRVLGDAGYAFAKVTGSVRVDIAKHESEVSFAVVPGPPAVYGPLRVVGLREIPEAQVRSSLGLRQGAAFSQAELQEAQRALLNLGVFSSVQVRPEVDRAQGNRVPISVLVDETELRTLRAGGGFQLDTLQLSSHLTVGWENRNFLGGLRRFSVDAKPGVVLYPTRFGEWRTPDRGLFHNQLQTQLRQPAFLEGRTTGVLSGSHNVYPLLYADSKPDEGILGFSEVRLSGALERSFYDHRLFLRPSYNWQLEQPVDYSTLTLGRGVPANDELLRDLYIAYPEVVVSLDLRDDPVNTTSGAWFSLNAQTAVQWLGSDLNDVRLRPEMRLYKPISRSVTLAVRSTAGLLFPRNYGDSLTAEEGSLTAAALAQDQQRLLFRGFFSGGPNSNRGYPLREVGPHGNVGFLSRNLDCSQVPLPRDCSRPLGGVALWEVSGEIRIALLGPLGGVLFADASDVSRRLALSFTAPHLSMGWGLRYGTPIGPIRFDMGVRMPGLQNLREETEVAPEPLFGLPMALHLTLGEAF